MLVGEGDSIRAGDIIARLTTDRMRVERQAKVARVDALRAQSAIAQQEEARLSRLAQRGAVATNAVDRARVRRLELDSSVSQAESALQAMDLQLESATLISPLDGTIGAVRVAPGETVSQGQPVVELFQSSALHLRVGLPAAFDHRKLRDPVVRLDDRTYPAQPLSVRTDIDAATNTRAAVYQVEGAGSVGFGRVATLVGQELKDERGAWVPLDALRPSAEGSWTLLAVTEAMQAQRLDVEVLHQRGGTAYVEGDFEDGQRIISAGVQRVVPGQSVRVD